MSKADDLRRCNRAEIAELFGVTPNAVDGWVRRGCPVLERGSRGKRAVMDVIAVAEWRFGARVAGDNVDPETLPPAERKQWYEGEKHRRAIQVADRELIPVEEVEGVIAQAFASLAQAIQSLPDTLEQDASLTPAQAEAAEQSLYASLDSIADQLAALGPVGG